MKTTEQAIENLIEEAQRKLDRARAEEDWVTCIKTRSYINGLTTALQIVIMAEK